MGDRKAGGDRLTGKGAAAGAGTVCGRGSGRGKRRPRCCSTLDSTFEPSCTVACTAAEGGRPVGRPAAGGGESDFAKIGGGKGGGGSHRGGNHPGGEVGKRSNESFKLLRYLASGRTARALRTLHCPRPLGETTCIASTSSSDRSGMRGIRRLRRSDCGSLASAALGRACPGSSCRDSNVRSPTSSAAWREDLMPWLTNEALAVLGGSGTLSSPRPLEPRISRAV
jgi:hypothetical protein